jgi:class 3 adenylate cyclase
MRCFLSFLVDETLAGRATQLKEYAIATCVFGKPDDFEPGTSAVVRVEAGRLRRLIEQYRSQHGAGDTIELQVPKGSYIPVFVRLPSRPLTEAPATQAQACDTRVERSVVVPLFSQEKRVVTALSCALSCAPKGDEADGGLHLLDRLQERCAEIGLAHGGEVDASASDRLMVYFGWPSALEDAPGRAITAALEMIGETVAAAAEHHAEVRIGIATSDAITRSHSGETPKLRAAVIGEGPALATRMQLKAPPNAVVVSEATRRMTGTSFRFLPAGELEGSGLTWRLLGASTIATRFQARHMETQDEILGRSEERALLMSRWRLALGGEGQGVYIVGEAGIGKSRLAELAFEQIGRSAILLRVQCSPHHANSALFPVVELIKSRIGFQAERRELDAVLSRILLRLGLDNATNRMLLGALLRGDSHGPGALSASQRKALTLELLLAIVAALTVVRPVALLVEDVHWADPTTLELLQALTQAGASSRILLIMTSRPQELAAFASSTNVSAIRLPRLPREDCQALIDRISGGSELSGVSRDMILQRSEGIPLFLEELTKLLLAGQPTDGWQSAIPERISDLLAAQLDRLGSSRAVAQMASTVGRTFSRTMLALIAEREEADLDEVLDQLLAAGVFIRHQSASSNMYAFRHALLRDAAYHSLVDATRKALHLQVANVLIETFPEDAAEHPEVVAHHLMEGGRPEKAMPFWTDAGRLAARRYALIEAIAHQRLALIALKSMNDGDTRERELALLLELGLAIRSARGYGDDELVTIYERALALAGEVGRPSQQAEVVYGLWTHAAGCGWWRSALQLAEQFGQRAGLLSDDDQAEVETLRLLGASNSFMGDFAQARDQFERAFGLYDPSRNGPRFGFDPGAVVAAYLSWTLWHLGKPAAGKRYAGNALALAEAKGHPPTLAMVLAWLMFHAVCEEDLEAIERYNLQLQAVCAERECRYWQPFGSACAEWAGFERDGDARRLDRLLESADGFGERYLTSCLLVLGARVCLKLGQVEKGLQVVGRVQKFMEEHDEWVWEAEAARLEGELLYGAPGDTAARAEACLLHAVDVARRQRTVALEGRAIEALGRLFASFPRRSTPDEEVTAMARSLS